MDKAFIYGMSVEGKNFTDRELETKRLQLNFENGMNSILISPRRIGKNIISEESEEPDREPRTDRSVYGYL